MTQPVIFISYSHKDEKEKDRLLSHLGVLQREGLISLWSDDRIGVGANWKQEISKAMAQARVAILLISANFLTSDFTLGEEVPALLQRRQSEGLTIFPVIARPCAWQQVGWLTEMKVRPQYGRPIWGARSRRVDEDLATLATEVAAIVETTSNIIPTTGGIYRESEGAGNTITRSTMSSDVAKEAQRARRIRMSILNPFIYGKPVSGTKHINRQKEQRTLFNRLRNGECTAVVGEPRIGKTSLLHCLASPHVQKEWLGEQAREIVAVEIDCYQDWLSTDKTPKDFWKYVLDMVKMNLPDETIQRQVALVEENDYGSATLANFFRNLARKELRVVLLIDEFDALLTHPNFSTAEFLGGLRSMAMRDGFQIITASIMPVEEMNRRSEASNPLGSPFFNHFTEVNLEPFSYEDVNILLDTFLNGSGVQFDPEDRDFIVWLSGRHPFRIQVAGAALFDTITDGLERENRYAQTTGWFYSC